MPAQLTIPHEVADGIALASLQDQLLYIREETRLHLEQGQWLHPDDLVRNQQLIPALELLIEHYGG